MALNPKQIRKDKTMLCQKSIKIVSTLLLLIGFITTNAVLAEDKNGNMSTVLTVTGAVKNSLSLTLKDLQAMNQSKKINDIAIVCQSGVNKGQMESLTGVSLKTILLNAELDVSQPKDFRKLVIIAKATDPYWVTYSWGEIFNRQDGDDVIVYYARDGKLLNEKEGQFALMPTRDSRTGARQVKWLTHIEVRKVAH